jgi:hypothetical protein
MKVYEYDFTRPLGLRQEPPNPRQVAALGRYADTHCPMAGTVEGAGGVVYAAGVTYGRRREGGGLGWYDPHSGEAGGIELDERVFWMTVADAGRYVILSVKQGAAREYRQLQCWDARRRAFAYRKRIPEFDRAGPLVEALPGGLVMGHASSPAEGGGLLYGLEAATGEILWRKRVPAPPVTGFSSVRRLRHAFRRGPQGYVWTFLGRTLVRIDPRDVRIEAVGRYEGEAKPIAFAVGDVYIAGGAGLLRFEGLRVGR